jgi:hypothetical protein
VHELRLKNIFKFGNRSCNCEVKGRQPPGILSSRLHRSSTQLGLRRLALYYPGSWICSTSRYIPLISL